MNTDSAPAREYAHNLSAAFRGVLGDALLAGYLHGSAAMEGWLPRTSDIDLLFVVNERVTAEDAGTLALAAQGLDCPGGGVELSIVRSPVDLPPGLPAFELHLTTGSDAKVVSGAGHPGDADLVLHYAVCRARGVTLFGPPPDGVLPVVARSRLIAGLLDELHWAAAEAPWQYTVLNACRAAAFAATGAIYSKLEGVAWAERTEFHDHLALQAWKRQSSGSGESPDRPAMLAVVADAQAALMAALEREA